MPKYYDAKTKTLVETDKELPMVGLRMLVGKGSLEHVEFIGTSAPRDIERPQLPSARMGLGGLWTKPTYVSNVDGSVVQGHFDLTNKINHDLRLVEHTINHKCGPKFDDALIEEEKSATPTP
ncbi:MAG: hypothetical protein P1U63_09905 [Coxiellaceae bacterium]|nr:hypothetical protein [Coxiellaceae bacterium]